MSKIPKVGIIDYGLGNIYSVNKVCQHVGINAVLVSDTKSLVDLDAIILPGVGAFGEAMKRLNELDFVNRIKEKASSGTPLLGICLGMQLLMSYSDEFGHNDGLGLIEGKVVKFVGSESQIQKIPQIQWNTIRKNNENDYLFSNIENDTFFYFLHSYYVIPNNLNVISARTTYMNIEYCCAIQKNNIFGVQFHPEKSSLEGIQIFQNFKNFINNEKH